MSARRRYALTGVPAHARAACACAEGAGRGVIVLLASNLGSAESAAEETAHLLRLLTEAEPTARTLTEADAAVPAFEADCDLLGVLSLIRHGAHGSKRPLLIASTPGALSRPSPAPEAAGAGELVIRKGEPLSPRRLVARLAEEFGYSHEALCEQPGDFAVRGGVIDVYPLNAQTPVRIDLFGETVESLRTFDPATQLSEGETDGLVICAPGTAGREVAPFWRHLPAGSLIVATERSLEDPGCAQLGESAADLLVLEETDEPPAGVESRGLDSLPAEVVADTLVAA